MRSSMSLRTRFFLLVAAGSIATATTAYLLHFRFLDNLERQTIDLRFSLRGDQAPPKDVVIVKVDDVTFSDHKQWRWPFDRKLHARDARPDPQGQAEGGRLRHPVQRARLGRGRQRARLRAAPQPRARRRSPRPRFTTKRLSRTSSSTRRRWTSSARARATRTSRPTRTGSSAASRYEVEGSEGIRGRRRRDRRSAERSRRRRWARDMQWIDYAGSPGTITSYSYSRVHDGKVPPERVQGQDRGHRRDGAVASGHPRDADGCRHGRPRDPGERDRDGACAASRCAASSTPLEHRAHRRARARRAARQPARRAAHLRRRRHPRVPPLLARDAARVRARAASRRTSTRWPR